MSSINFKYGFVQTSLDRNSINFINLRYGEEEITDKVRSAANFCKSISGISGNDLSKITRDDKMNVEKCLKENYLDKNPNYFGQRQTIFLDMH